jgi:RNA polymerase sigma-70 factor (sigma-E family)
MIGQGKAPPASARSAEHGITELDVHYDKLVRLAVLLTGNLPAAEDAVQNAYLAVWLARGRPQDAGSGFDCLRKAVVNNARSELRHRAVADRNTPQAPHDAPGTEQEAPVRLGSSALVAALGRLSPRQRQVIVLQYYGGLSEAEIAEVLGIRQGSVKGHAARGMAALRSVLGGSGQRQGSGPDSGGFAGIPGNAPEDAGDIIYIP